GSQKFFLLSLWWTLKVDESVRVPRAKVSSGISEYNHYMSSPNVKPSYRRIKLSGRG
ncbi:BgTH12-01485, partial [Blumeria graminis f. sp. triticale]